MPSKRTGEKEAMVTQWVSDLADFYCYQIKERAAEFWLHELCEWSFKTIRRNPTEEHYAKFQTGAWKELARRALERHNRMPMIADLLEIYDEMREEFERERNTEHMRQLTEASCQSEQP